MYYLMMAAYKNLSSLLVQSDTPKPIGRRSSGFGFGESSSSTKRSYRTSVELISPIVQMAIPDGYFFPPNSHIKINFNLSKEHRSHDAGRLPLPSMPTGTIPTTLRGTYFSCGALTNSSVSTKMDYGSLRWIMDACPIDVHESFVECQCETLGIFGLLKVGNFVDVSGIKIIKCKQTRLTHILTRTY